MQKLKILLYKSTIENVKDYNMNYLIGEFVSELYPDISHKVYSLSKEFADDYVIEGYAGNNGILNAAVASGDTNHVIKLLKNKLVNPSINNNKTLKLACEHGNFNVVQILLEDDRINPFAIFSTDHYSESPIMKANKECHFKIVEILLMDKRFDKLDNLYKNIYVNDILENASINGNINMVQYIVDKYPDCIPKWNDYIIDEYYEYRYLYCAKDYLNILKIILTHPNFDIDGFNDSYVGAIHEAINNDDIELLKVLLLKYGMPIDGCEISIAVRNNNIEHLKLIIAYQDIDFNEYEYEPTETDIYIACTFQNLDIIKLLIEIGRDPSINNNQAYYYALNNNMNEIAEYLLTDKRVADTIINKRRRY